MNAEAQKNKQRANNLKGIYAITDEHLIAEPDFNFKIEQALLGGANIIQYRDKSNDTTKRLQQALSLRQLCEKHNAICIINDDIELAKSVQAHGVHLGKNDASPLAAREILGNEAIIGVSCYSDISLAVSFEKMNASYVAFGAIFPSPTKPNAPVAGLDVISQAKKKLSLPICAIGGITHKNIHQVVHHSADMVAVISEIFASDRKSHSDIKQATQNLRHHYN